VAGMAATWNSCSALDDEIEFLFHYTDIEGERNASRWSLS
jgi:hypothetical protein